MPAKAAADTNWEEKRLLSAFGIGKNNLAAQFPSKSDAWAPVSIGPANAFTMDDGYAEAVQTAFIQLFDQGLIYRGTRLVNWDPELGTAISDLEVENKEEQGFLWHFRYPLAGGVKTKEGDDFLVVATTRPETMLGDTAVAVHPDDERYAHLIGATITLPLVGREIPVIADDYVDMAFGTGCVKITPAHDFNDNEMGARHNLESINILTPEAKINDDCA